MEHPPTTIVGKSRTEENAGGVSVITDPSIFEEGESTPSPSSQRAKANYKKFCCFGIIIGIITVPVVLVPVGLTVAHPGKKGLGKSSVREDEIGNPRGFESGRQLRDAVDSYLEDPGPTTEVANGYGHPIGSWNVSGIKDFSSLFSAARNERAESFNEPLGDWDVSAAVNMSFMFEGAAHFNQNLSLWDVADATSMNFMFSEAVSFNVDISQWDVAKVTEMRGMFRDALSFNQDLSDWDARSLTNMAEIFFNASSFHQNLCAWGPRLEANAVNTESSFAGTLCLDPRDPKTTAAAPGPFCYDCDGTLAPSLRPEAPSSLRPMLPSIRPVVPTPGEPSPAPVMKTPSLRPAAPSPLTDGPAGSSVVEVLEANQDFSSLRSALDMANLTGPVSQSQDITMFAPLNDAFDSLLPNRRELRQPFRSRELQSSFMQRLESSPWHAHLTHLMRHHILDGDQYDIDDLEDGKELVMLSGETVVVSVDTNGTAALGGIPLGRRGFPTANGFLHPLGDFLRPRYLSTSAMDQIEGTHKRFAAFVDIAGLTSILSDRSNEYTIFAFEDTALESLDQETKDTLVSLEALDIFRLVQYHIVVDVHGSADIPFGTSTMTTLGGDDISIVRDEQGMSIFSVSVTGVDTLVSNGIVHSVGGILGLDELARSPTESPTNICDFECPLNSERIPDVECHASFKDCRCLDGSVRLDESCTPTKLPTSSPMLRPTNNPSRKPVSARTSAPSRRPTKPPVGLPTWVPTHEPTNRPVSSPTSAPRRPATPPPTIGPTVDRSSRTTDRPTLSPTNSPTSKPPVWPTSRPTAYRTSVPTTEGGIPTFRPTQGSSRTSGPTGGSSPTSRPTEGSSLTSSPPVGSTLNPTALLTFQGWRLD